MADRVLKSRTHGTNACYAISKCRCAACRAAHAAANRGGAAKRDELQARLVETTIDLQRERDRLMIARAVLHEVSEARGPFSRDPLTHATNVIENLQRMARETLDEFKKDYAPLSLAQLHDVVNLLINR